jgi:hypothetical protein
LACGIALAQQQEGNTGYTKLTYGFVENRGQILDQDSQPNPEAKFILALSNANVILRKDGFSYDTYIVQDDSIDKVIKKDELSEMGLPTKARSAQVKFHRVDIKFEGANENVEIIKSEPSSDYIIYYTGKSEVPGKLFHYGKILYKNIYPGIDIEFVARPGEKKPIEYNFIVHPGADISSIKLSYIGANEAEIINNEIVLTLAHGKLKESIPASYWRESKKGVSVRYKEISHYDKQLILGFSTKGSMRSNEALIIDPTPSLEWGTYYGGAGGDGAQKSAIDAAGNIYAVGSTNTLSGMATSGAYQTTFGGGTEYLSDAFLIKMSSSGARLWSTYYGGTGTDSGYGIVIDASSNVYVTGYTRSSSNISTPGSFQPSMQAIFPAFDGFLAKFDASGTRLWGTYIGEVELGNSLAVDASGNVYVVGATVSSSAHVSTVGSHQPTFGGNTDGYLMKFTSGGFLSWGTFYGGANFDNMVGVCVDNNDNLYVAGSSQSPTAISTPGAYQVDIGGISSSFIVKFNATTGVRQWATYYGSGAQGAAWGIATDASGNVYSGGVTYAPNNISSPGAYQSSIGGSPDAFLVKFNSTGVRQWGTYYGGANYDLCSQIAVDASSNIYLTGKTSSTTSIATSGAYKTTLTGSGSTTDAFVSKFNSSGTLQWGTYYGGSGDESGSGIIKNGQNIFVSGSASSTAGVATTGAFQATFGGGTSDAFIAKFVDASPCPPPITPTITATPNICAMKFTTEVLSNCLTTYTWNFGDGGTSSERNPLHIYAANGTYNVSVRIQYTCPDCQSEVTVNKQVVYTAPTVQVQDLTLQIPTDQRPNIISTAASSFSDAWPLSQANSALDNRNVYLNGSQGVWRNSGTFIYQKDRNISPSTNIASDGTFTMEQFNWQYASLNAVPNWIRANTMTRYSPYSYELENQDALGVSSGAIYDYFGQLPTANGVNMRQDEMAFTSFEFKDNVVAPDNPNTPDYGVMSGNWILKTGTIPDYTYYNIRAGNGNLALVEASVAQLGSTVAVDVASSWPFNFLFRRHKTYLENEIVCVRAHPTNPAWSLVVLKTAPENLIWVGTMRIKNTVTPSAAPVIDNTVAHSGTQSLKLTSTDLTIKQDLLNLDIGKSYVINGWVKPNAPNLADPSVTSGLGIVITARQQNGTLITAFPIMAPSGPVIEGWQQVRGVFTVPANTTTIDLTFKAGTAGTSWYDDLRLHPESGNMKSYVYTNDFRLRAILDEENFGSFFYYDVEGNLYLTKKETKDGIKTLTENISYLKER